MPTRRHSHFNSAMAARTLLLALALAPVAHALGVTKPNDPTIPCDCPETIEGGEIVLPCGADGESYEVDPCNVFACNVDLGEWDPEPVSCEDSEERCDGTWVQPDTSAVPPECCGRCISTEEPSPAPTRSPIPQPTQNPTDK